MRAIALTLTVCSIVAAPPLFAAVTVESLSKAKFSGGASVVNVFAGKAAKEGVIVKTSIEGDRSATMTNREIEVVDLAAEKIWNYKVNRRGKPGRCKVTSFDERREALAALRDLDFTGGQQDPDGEEMPELPEYEVTVAVNETGEEETHAGMTGEVYQIEVLVHRPDMTLEEGGGARIDTSVVIGPKPAGWNETIEWNRRYFEALGFEIERFEGLGKLLASTPALQQAVAGLEDKQSALDGAVLRSETQFFTMADPRAAEQEESEEDGDIPTSIGGLGAKIGGSLLKRNREKAAAAGPREVFMSSTALTSYAEESDSILTLPDRCEQ